MTNVERQSRLDNALDALLGLLIGPQKPHAHRCGFDLDNPNAAGCGQEWTHDPKAMRSAEEHNNAHYCPRCHRGPWSWQLTDDTREEFQKRYHKAA